MTKNGRTSGLWEGGERARSTFDELAPRLKSEMRSGDRQERIDAYVSWASALYSQVGESGFLKKAFFLVRAKYAAQRALAEYQGADEAHGILNPSQLDVLSTIFLRGVKVCTIGVEFLAPNPEDAHVLAERGLDALSKDEPAHTRLLLFLTVAEAFLERHPLSEMLWAKIEGINSYLEKDADIDSRQHVRILKRLGALMVKSGYKSEEGWGLIRKARAKAEQVAKGQVCKIDQLIAELTRPSWHWRSWLVQVV